MIRTVAILTLFIACVHAESATFTNCLTPSEGKILWVDVEPCNSDPCKFKPNSTANINGQFISNVDISSPILVTQIESKDDWINYPGIDNDACKYTDCPIQANVANSFTIAFKTFSLSSPTKLRFQIFNSDGSKELICAETIVDGY